MQKIWDKLSPRTSQSMPGRMPSLSAEFQFSPGLLQRLSSICLPVEFSLTFLFDCVTLSIDAALVVSASEPFEVTPRYNSCAASFFIIADRKGIRQFQLEKAACFLVDFLLRLCYLISRCNTCGIGKRALWGDTPVRFLCCIFLSFNTNALPSCIMILYVKCLFPLLSWKGFAYLLP